MQGIVGIKENLEINEKKHGGARENAGRIKKEIDWELFENLCEIQCTQQEIASMLKIHVDTLRDRALEHYKEDEFSTIYKKYSESGKCSLRRNQFVLSKTNAAMAIWLGKQWLGQTETPTEITLNPEAMNKFNELMTMLQSLQSIRKAADSKAKAEYKS